MNLAGMIPGKENYASYDFLTLIPICFWNT